MKRGAFLWRIGVPAIVAGCILMAVFALLQVRQTQREQQGLATRVSGIQQPRASDEIPCPKSAPDMPPLVILALGQSNGGNHGSTRGKSPVGALWFEGRCYPVADPLPGATGSGGSIWSRLAASLAADVPGGLILSVLAVDATSSAEWTREGPLADRLSSLLDEMRKGRIQVSAVLWQQGEADARAGVSPTQYANSLGVLVRRLREGGIGAPVFVARSTRCGNSGGDNIRDGAAMIAVAGAGVLLGPDTDQLGDAMRSDGCHFNAAGLDAAALAWRRVLEENGVVARLRPAS